MSIQNKLNDELLLSAEKGDLKAVKFLLENGADINAVDKYKQTALIKSVWNKRENVSLFLIEKGAEPDLQDCFKNTALMYTAFGAQKKVFNALLERGASPHFEDRRGDKMADLLYRIYQLPSTTNKQDYVDMISVFIPDFVYQQKQRDLRVAIVEGHEGLVGMMLAEDDVDVNDVDGAGISPLQWAVVFNREKAAYCLIELGAEVNYQNKRGMTALMYAAANGFKNMVYMLIEKGADVSLKNKEGETAMMLAYLNRHEEICKMLHLISTKKIQSANSLNCEQSSDLERGNK